MTATNTDAKVVIVGGGVAGASLACALAHQKIRSVLLERHKTFVDLNRGDGMQARSLEIMAEWGLLPAFMEAGPLHSYGSEVYHPILGKLVEVDLSVIKSPYPYILNLPHREIEAFLLGQAEKSTYCTVLPGVSVQEVLFKDGRATGVRARQDGKDTVFEAPVVAGADGLQSAVRRSVEIAAVFQPYPHDLLVLHAHRPSWFTGRLRTRSYMYREGATILIPLPHDAVRIGVLVPSGAGGRWKSQSNDVLLQALVEKVPGLRVLEGLERHGEHIYKPQRMHAEAYARKGIVLVGDSAHVTHPAGGQGMNMALQDGDVLASELRKVFDGGQSLDTAYTNYERIRRPLNQGVIDRAHFMAWLLWSSSAPAYVGKSLYTGFMRYLVPPLYSRVVRSIASGMAGVASK
jgi:2-polyprenyl-6-methoxyphenol hydroxylase-like FAD-dependent oxidoreductase